MARARNIKPKFFQNDELGALPPLARLLFIGMWTIADYRGCIEYRPARMKVQLLPYDNCDIEALSISLDKSGFISIYTVQGQRYIKILKFERHQTPHKNERDSGSELPDLVENDNEISELTKDGTNPDKNGTTRAESFNLNPESFNLNPSIPAVAERPKRAAKTVDENEFEKAWSAYPKRPGASKADTLKAWAARLREGSSAEDMIAGVQRYSEYVRKSGTDPVYIKQPATFFGPGKHYEADWGFAAKTNGQPLNDKFHVSHLDHSSSNAAMAASMKKHGIVVPADDDDVPF